MAAETPVVNCSTTELYMMWAGYTSTLGLPHWEAWRKCFNLGELVFPRGREPCPRPSNRLRKHTALCGHTGAAGLPFASSYRHYINGQSVINSVINFSQDRGISQDVAVSVLQSGQSWANQISWFPETQQKKCWRMERNSKIYKGW